jgi:hypothetical protein
MPGGADRPGDSAYCVQLAPIVVMTMMPAMPSAAYRNGDEDAGLSADGDREKKQHNSPVAHGPSSLVIRRTGSPGIPADDSAYSGRHWQIGAAQYGIPSGTRALRRAQSEVRKAVGAPGENDGGRT